MESQWSYKEYMAASAGVCEAIRLLKKHGADASLLDALDRLGADYLSKGADAPCTEPQEVQELLDALETLRNVHQEDATYFLLMFQLLAEIAPATDDANLIKEAKHRCRNLAYDLTHLGTLADGAKNPLLGPFSDKKWLKENNTRVMLYILWALSRYTDMLDYEFMFPLDDPDFSRELARDFDNPIWQPDSLPEDLRIQKAVPPTDAS